MQSFALSRFVTRVAQPRSVGQVRGFQPALREPSGLPDFTYRALLVDAAGTLLIPSEPAAEVSDGALLLVSCKVLRVIHSRRAGVSSIWRQVWRKATHL